MDTDSGRYLFGLVSEFRQAGLQPVFARNFRLLATMRYKPFKRALLDHSFRVRHSLDEIPAQLLAAVITDRPVSALCGGPQVIRVSYEAALPAAGNEVAFPYFVHPEVYARWATRRFPDLNCKRHWRVFFSGTIHKQKQFGTNVLRERFEKLSRREILEALEAGLPAQRIRRVTEPGAMLHVDGPQPKFVWARPDAYRIPVERWLEVLQCADFLLACPGNTFPLCHNLIEGMSVGTVPLLEHPEYLDPPLEDGVNCIAFSGRDGLLAAFARVFGLGAPEILRLRQGALAYHEEHHAPGVLARRLLTPTSSQAVKLLLFACTAPRRQRKLHPPVGCKWRSMKDDSSGIGFNPAESL